MIKLIVGKKGSGKTKKLIDLVNDTAKESKGSVVCIEKGDVLTLSISHQARLVDINDYNVAGYDEYYGFLSGLCAGNHDITDIFGDATLRIGNRDYDKLVEFLDRTSSLAKATDVNFYFTVSCDENEIPAKAFEIAKEI